MRTTSPLMVSMSCADGPGFIFSGAECCSAACVAVPKPTPSTHDRTPITLSFEITTASSLVWLFKAGKTKARFLSNLSLLLQIPPCRYCVIIGGLKSPLPSQFLHGVFLKHLHFM